MDAISSAGAHLGFGSWDPTLLQNMGKDKSNIFVAAEHAASAVESSVRDPYARRKSQVKIANEIFADSTATTTLDSIKNFFKNGRLQDSIHMASYAADYHDSASDGNQSFSLSREEADINLARGNGLSVNTSQGTTVNVQRGEPDGDIPGDYQFNISRKDGFQLSIHSNDNVRISDLEDGGLSILYASTGETHIYDAEGNKKDVLQGEAGALVGTSGDDLLINLHGASVDGGDGNDTIVNFADNATITGGNGDDTIVLGRTVANNTINTGEGNDHLLGLGACKRSSINMGEGNNRVQLGYLGRNSELAAGDGDNNITIGLTTSIRLGNGNNTLRAVTLGTDTQLGDGNNTIATDCISGEITAGDGNNTVNTRSANKANVTFGDGNNTIAAESVVHSKMNLGDGNNTITADGLFWGNTITAGDGNNTIDISSLSHSHATFGNGSNAFTADSIVDSWLTVGNGNNTADIRLSYNSRVAFGEGNNSVALKSVFGSNLILGKNTELLDALRKTVAKPDLANKGIPQWERTV